MNNEREVKMSTAGLAFKIANEFRQEGLDNASLLLEDAISVAAQDVIEGAPVSPDRAAAVRKTMGRLTDGATLDVFGALEVLVDARREVGWIRRATLVDGLVDLCASMAPENVHAELASVVDEIKVKIAAKLLALKASNSGT